MVVPTTPVPASWGRLSADGFGRSKLYAQGVDVDPLDTSPARSGAGLVHLAVSGIAPWNGCI